MESVMLNDTFSEVGIRILDTISKSSKNRIITRLINENGFSKNPDKLRAISQQEKEALNRYFNEVDYVAISKGTEDGVKIANTISDKTKLVAIPAGITLMIGIIIGKKLL